MTFFQKTLPAAIAFALVTSSGMLAPASAAAIASPAQVESSSPAVEAGSEAGPAGDQCFWKRHRVWTYYGAVWKRYKVCY